MPSLCGRDQRIAGKDLKALIGLMVLVCDGESHDLGDHAELQCFAFQSIKCMS